MLSRSAAAEGGGGTGAGFFDRSSRTARARVGLRDLVLTRAGLCFDIRAERVLEAAAAHRAGPGCQEHHACRFMVSAIVRFPYPDSNKGARQHARGSTTSGGRELPVAVRNLELKDLAKSRLGTATTRRENGSGPASLNRLAMPPLQPRRNGVPGSAHLPEAISSLTAPIGTPAARDTSWPVDVLGSLGHEHGPTRQIPCLIVADQIRRNLRERLHLWRLWDGWAVL